jgi:type VI secretion system secreted protein VgrG
VPVFLLYAGILHAIGLALLLPMPITLPGPAGEPAPAPAPAPTPEIAPIDVIVLPPPQALTDAGPEHTSALPSAPPAEAGTATQPAEPAKAEHTQVEPPSAETPVKEEIEAAPEPKVEAIPEPKEAAPEVKPQTAPATEATESPETMPAGTEGSAERAGSAAKAGSGEGKHQHERDHLARNKGVSRPAQPNG